MTFQGKDGASEKSLNKRNPPTSYTQQLPVLLMGLHCACLGDFPRDTFRGHFGGNGDVLHLNDGGSYTAA